MTNTAQESSRIFLQILLLSADYSVACLPPFTVKSLSLFATPVVSRLKSHLTYLKNASSSHMDRFPVEEKFWVSPLLFLIYLPYYYYYYYYYYVPSNSTKHSLMCGNKMPTRCNSGFYCRSYCLLNMFRTPLCPSSGAQEYYTVVATCILQTGHITLSSTPDQQLENHSTKYHRQQPMYNTLELLTMGIVVSETCWASNKICNKNLCCI